MRLSKKKKKKAGRAIDQGRKEKGSAVIYSLCTFKWITLVLKVIKFVTFYAQQQ